MKKYIFGITIALLIASTAFATQITQKIDVLFNAINIEINGEKVDADNILYNGTTYIPLRKVSEILDKEVKWEEETKTAKINDRVINEEQPIVTIETNSGEIIKIELYPTVAKNTVNNFISLINKGYYDGVEFHRVVPGFVIQGGDPLGTGFGGPGYTIKGEFNRNGFKNNLGHTRGVVSMARSADPNSAGSQFFIVLQDAPNLDGDYAAFGKVIRGMDVVDKISNVERDGKDKPLQPQKIKKVSVELFGKTYEQPQKIK